MRVPIFLLAISAALTTTNAIAEKISLECSGTLEESAFSTFGDDDRTGKPFKQRVAVYINGEKGLIAKGDFDLDSCELTSTTLNCHSTRKRSGDDVFAEHWVKLNRATGKYREYIGIERVIRAGQYGLKQSHKSYLNQVYDGYCEIYEEKKLF